MEEKILLKNNFLRLQAIIVDLFGLDLDQVKLRTRSNQVKQEADFVKDLGADSLDVVELVIFIFNEFEIEIDDEVASQISTVQDALNYIEGRWDKI